MKESKSRWLAIAEAVLRERIATLMDERIEARAERSGWVRRKRSEIEAEYALDSPEEAEALASSALRALWHLWELSALESFLDLLAKGIVRGRIRLLWDPPHLGVSECRCASCDATLADVEDETRVAICGDYEGTLASLRADAATDPRLQSLLERVEAIRADGKPPKPNGDLN